MCTCVGVCVANVRMRGCVYVCMCVCVYVCRCGVCVWVCRKACRSV